MPVLLDDEVTDGTSIQENAFDAVLMVLRALGANDERIIEYFRSVSQGKRWKRGTRPIEIDIPEEVVVDAGSFINSVELQFWSRLAKLSWRDFEEARGFVRSLRLKSWNEWEKYKKGELTRKGTLPQDIPAKPQDIYKDKGWKSFGDWLGTGTVATQKRKYRSFKDAREFVYNLGLENKHEWSEYCKGEMPEKGILLKDIPANPRQVYEDKGWKGWGDWLGTGTVAPQNRKFRSFKEARTFVHSLGLKNGNEWIKYCKGELPVKGKLPEDIPADPKQVFKDKGWKGMGDWLGTGTVAHRDRKYRAFKEACEFVRSLGLNNQKEWREYCKGKLIEKGTLPEDIPANPNVVYKDKGWKRLGDWLGTGTIAPRERKYLPFKKARAFVRSLRLKSGYEWIKYYKGELPGKRKLSEDIPAKPMRVYKDKGWKGMGDWLGTGTVAHRDRKFRTFKEARVFIQSLGLKSWNEWIKYCKGELTKKGKLPKDIPGNPNQTYKDKGWKGMGDWLGTGTVAYRYRKYRPFKKARAFAHSLGLKSRNEWEEYCKGQLTKKGKLPEDIPNSPNHVYKDQGWKGVGDWLGTGTVATQHRKYRSFKEARAFVHSLGLMNRNEWREYCKGKLTKKGALPNDIPGNPNQTYKDKGWKGMGNWLGTDR